MQQEKRSFGAALTEFFMGLLARLPLKFHLACGRFFSWVLRGVLHYRRDVVTTNLARSCPELKYKQRSQLARKSYDHLGDIFAEAIWFGGCKNAKGRRRLNESRIVDIANPATFNEVYDNSTNMMVLSSHAGNWELLGGFFSYNHNEEIPLRSGPEEIVVVYRRLKSKTWDRVMEDNRCNSLKDTGFQGYLESMEVFRFAIAHRKEKFIYIFPTDQYPYSIATKHNVGKFLNQETLAMTGGAALACKFGMSVSYLRWKVVERGRYSLELVPICGNAADYTPERIMEMYYAELEKDIQDQPWNYLWTHKRWK